MSLKQYIKRGVRYIMHGVPEHKVYVQVSSIAPNELLKGRTALITGGTSGIGFAIATAYLKSGCNVVITGRSQERLDEAKNKLSVVNNKLKIISVRLDNMEVCTFEKTFMEILEKINANGISHIDILVNNAGVNSKGMPNEIEEEYDKVLDTNLKGVFFLSQMFGKYLVTNKIQGNILNIASASSLCPADSAYTVSKWGLRGLTLGLAKSLAKYGITVNGIAPGPTATPMMIHEKTDDMKLDRLPLGRYIMSEEISNMAVILVSNMGKAIMGDIVYMTGGAGVLTYDDVPYSF